MVGLGRPRRSSFTRTLPEVFSRETVPLPPELCSGCRASLTASLWGAWPAWPAWELPPVHPTIKMVAGSARRIGGGASVSASCVGIYHRSEDDTSSDISVKDALKQPAGEEQESSCSSRSRTYGHPSSFLFSASSAFFRPPRSWPSSCLRAPGCGSGRRSDPCSCRTGGSPARPRPVAGLRCPSSRRR
jgi:hypothetical protein